MASSTPMVSVKDLRHDWYVVDATNQVLGRLATRIARVLAGKALATVAVVAALGHVDDLLALREQTRELPDLAPQQPFRASVELRCDSLRDLLLRLPELRGGPEVLEPKGLPDPASAEGQVVGYDGSVDRDVHGPVDDGAVGDANARRWRASRCAPPAASSACATSLSRAPDAGH